MFALATDVLKIIMEFLDPEEIKELYVTCKDAKIMFDELTKHTNLIITCNTIILDREVKWFELRNIKLKLLETHRINIYGDHNWYKNGLRHRDNDLPATITSEGDLHWYRNGLCHRDNDLPAEIYESGSQYWFRNGLCHRDNDLPAVIRFDGTQFWYKNGKNHRDNDLPAIIRINGDQLWYKNGIRYIPN